MRFGLAIFLTDETLGPAELGRLAEERGYESLFFTEHTHIPASRETPYQRPHPPVLVGGNGPTVLDRVLGFGDEWMPNPAGDDDALLARIAELRERAGRDVPVSLNAATSDPGRLARFAQAGVRRAVFYLPSGDRDAIERRLEKLDRTRAALS